MIIEKEYRTLKLPSVIYDKIERSVVSLYKELNISHVPINPFEVVRRRGYCLKPFSSFDQNERNYFKQLDLDGFNYYDKKLSSFVICYDDSKVLERVRFTIMHEIGHIDMGHL